MRDLNWYKSSFSSDTMNCVEVSWAKSTFSDTAASCVEVGWARSSSCHEGSCVEVGWHQSSRCAGGDCVQVAHGQDAILMRDSKLGDDSPVLRFAVQSWWVLTDAIATPPKDDPWRPVHRSIAYDGDEVLLSTSVRSPKLRFTWGEWTAFVKGVRAAEFDPPTLSSRFQSSSPVEVGEAGEERAGTEVLRGVPVPAQPQTGPSPVNPSAFDHSVAGRLDHDPTSNPASRVLPETAHTDSSAPAVEEDGPVTADRSEAGTGTSSGPVPAARSGLIQYEEEGDDRSRGMRCGQCGQQTGNNHQGHYWKFCKVTRQMETFHFCCPDACDLAAAWREEYERLADRLRDLGVEPTLDNVNGVRIMTDKRWLALIDAVKAMDNDAEAWSKAAAPLVPTDGAP